MRVPREVTFFRWAAALVLCSCQPIVFPRTAEIAQPGAVALQGSAQLLTIEPQSVLESDGTKASSTVGLVPDLDFDVHVGLGRCETGLLTFDIGVLAEVRCAVLVQERGAPLSLALSGAAGATASAGIGFAPSARLGVDLSRRFGGVEPLVDVYLTTARQAHYIQTGVANDPVVGPVGVVFGRQEIRLSVPIGVAFVAHDKDHRPLDPAAHAAIVGIEPWFVLAAPGHSEVDPVPRSYTVPGWGLSFSFGVAFR